MAESSEVPPGMSRRTFLKKLRKTSLAIGAIMLVPDIALAKTIPPDNHSSEPNVNASRVTIDSAQLHQVETERSATFPEWEMPVFEAMWPYLTAIGEAVGLDPRILAAHALVESKGDILSGKDTYGNKGLLHITHDTAQAYMKKIFPKLPNKQSIIDSMREIGVDIVNSNGEPYPVVNNPASLVKTGENNLLSMFGILVAAIKIKRNFEGSIPDFEKHAEFIRKIPDNPRNHPSFPAVLHNLYKTVSYYVGVQQDPGVIEFYKNCVLSHIIPFTSDADGRDNKKSLSKELEWFYKSARFNPPDAYAKQIQTSVGNFGTLMNSYRAWNEQLTNNHPCKQIHFPHITLKDQIKASDRWMQMVQQYNI